MKTTKFACVIMLAISILSCSSDDDNNEISGKGELTIEFDNAYQDSDLILETTVYSAVETEKIKIAKVKYIVSNIRLEDEDGTIFTLPKDDSYFIVDESNEDSQFINLTDVPAGNYKKITFGIGVDQDKYLQGAEGQGDFLQKAQDAGMMWSWQAGYKFFVYEGLYTSENTPTETAFAFHMGSHGTAVDNYKEVTLDMPSIARVRTDISPIVHVVTDLNQVLDGSNQFKLDDAANIHVDAVKSPQIATNVSGMFMVHHIHN